MDGLVSVYFTYGSKKARFAVHPEVRQEVFHNGVQQRSEKTRETVLNVSKHRYSNNNNNNKLHVERIRYN